MGTIIGSGFLSIKVFDLLDGYFDNEIVYSYTGLIKKVKWVHTKDSTRHTYAIILGVLTIVGVAALATLFLLYIVNPCMCAISDSFLPKICEGLRKS
jgi:hypothetical protein